MKTNLIVTILLFFTAQFCISAQTLNEPYVPGEFIIQLKDGNLSAKTSAINNHLITKLNARLKKSYKLSNIQLWQLPSTNNKTDFLKIVEDLNNDPAVEFAEPNYIYSAAQIPNDTINEPINDPFFVKQWALNSDNFNEGAAGNDIDAIAAWEVKSSSPSVVVGLMDTGVDWKHPDLIDNIWQNLGEDKNGDGTLIKYDTLNKIWVLDTADIDNIDNDGNGYVDDFIGWNFADNNNQVYDYDTYNCVADTTKMKAHGTQVAGILGAVGNNGIGVAGVSWDVQIAVLKHLTDCDGLGNAANAIEALEYAVNMGMPITNNSWGGLPYSIGLEKAIEKAGRSNHIFVAAAGNGGFDKIGDNNDEQSLYPASYESLNVISVANINSIDELSRSSNFGAASVDLAAPGSNIMTCLPNGKYGLASGTSMAAPFVTGAAALFIDKYPNKTYFEIRDAILDNVDIKPELTGKCLSDGRLNLYNTLTAFGDSTNNITTASNCRNRDSLALLALYEATNGLSWIAEEGTSDRQLWDLNKSMNNWYGVRLNAEGCVISLDLDNFNLTGTLPAAIGNLTELYWLDLSRNKIGGSIPAEIGNLKKLQILYLSNNQLSGEIPAEIGNLQQLRHCSLYVNELSGEIPPEVFTLVRLTILNLQSNNLIGNIPAEIGNLVNLESIGLGGNNLTGSIPVEISNFKNLETLVLSGNNLTGEIPAVIGSLSKLSRIYLNNNNLEGSIPGTFGNLDLYVLRLNDNNLSGCYDPYLKNMGIQLSPHYLIDNSDISDGNTFDAPWEDFLDNNAGACWASEVTKVWPGDFNNDGQVSNDDYVYYGIAAGNTGTARVAVSDAWEGNLCPNWSNEINGVNGKHQDANGDGLVDTLDRNIIHENFGLNNYGENNNLTQLSYQTDDIGFTLEEIVSVAALSQDPETGTPKKYKYQYALKMNDDKAIKGLSIVIDFKTKLDSSSTVEAFQNCIDPDVLSPVFDYQKGILALAITNDKDDALYCLDGLARIAIVLAEEDLSEGGNSWSVKIGGITSELSNNDVNRTARSTYQGSKTLTTDGDSGLSIGANIKPQSCIAAGEATLNIIGGTAPYNILWNTGETTITISGLTMGSYTAVVTDSNNLIGTINISVAGQLDDCDYNADCPTVIDFDEYIPDEDSHTIPAGVYTAERAIQTSAKIIEGDEVDLQAGETILLKPGFSTGNNSILSIKTQNCEDE